MSQDADHLEQELLALGQHELAIETKMQLLKARMKAAVQAGRLDEADAAWALYEEQRAALKPLLEVITDVERAQYGLRRRQRR